MKNICKNKKVFRITKIIIKNVILIYKMFRLSFIGFIINGILMGIGILIFIIYYKEMDKNQLVLVILVGSIAVGIHSMLHYREEKEMRFGIIDD
jgi:hypothetical protein